jgi:glycosyltransferase involved in cell wall biosynthesis/outer membrane protein assembly factor BamB
MEWLTQQAKPDLVHLSNALLLGLAGRIRRELNVPVVCTLQDEDAWIDSMEPGAARAAWQLMTEKARDIAAFLPVSHYYSLLMQQRLTGVAATRFHQIPIGISPDQYQPALTPPDKPVLGYLSKMTESLGLETLVDAFIQLKQTAPLRSLQLKLMGGQTPDDTPFLRRLRRKLSARGMLADVEFCEGLTREHRVEFLQSLTVLSVPMPHPEAFGMFILESLACAVPVVQPRIGAFPEIISATDGGLCYDPADPDGLTGALKRLLLDPGAAHQLGQTGREAIRKEFNIHTTAERILAVYKQCLTATTVLLTSCLLCRAAPLPEPAHWPTYHGDAGLRGVATTSLPETLTVGWRVNVGGPVSQPPVVCKGVIYALSDRGEAIAVGLDGVKRWATALPLLPQPELFSTPPLCVDTLLLAGTDKGRLYAFDTGTGAIKWKVKIGEDLYGALNWLEPDGTHGRTALALSRNNGSLVRIELTTGQILWSSKPGGRSDGSPAVGNGFIVFGACDSALHFIAPASGALLARTGFDERGPMAGGVAVEGPRVYAGTRDGSILCADATTFTLLWTNQVAGNEIFTTPAVTSNRVLAGSSDGSMYCLNRADGRKLWSVHTEGSPASPVVAGNTVVVTSGGTVSLLSLAEGKTLWHDKPCDSLSPPAVAGGNIIIGTDDGFIMLYQPK